MREHILETAAALFYRNGIHSTGIDSVIAQAGVAKATLCGHFPGKEDLVVAYLRSRHERVLSGFEDLLAGNFPSARARIEAIFGLLEQKASSEEFRGCAFLMAVSEFSDAPRVIEVAQDHKLAVRDIFRRALRTDVNDPNALAEQLGFVYDGALAAIMIQRRSRLAAIGHDIAISLRNSRNGGSSASVTGLRATISGR